MKFENLQNHWNRLGSEDAMWAILTSPDRKNKKWDPKEFFQLGVIEIDSVLESVQDFRIESTAKRALDFGCGVGRLSQALAARGFQVVGVDIAHSMIEQAKGWNQYPELCSYRVNSSPDLSQFSDESFDFIYSNIVLQHIHPSISSKYIAEFVRCLSPKGVLVFQLPIAPSWSLFGALMRIIPIAVIRLIRKMDMYSIPESEVWKIVSIAGGRIVKTNLDHAAGPHWISQRYTVVRET